MSYEKRPEGETITPQWVDEQCRQFELVLAPFVDQMRSYFRKRAAQGRHRWNEPDKADGMYMDLLAHAAHSPLCANEEAHIANFAAFLWGLRMSRGART